MKRYLKAALPALGLLAASWFAPAAARAGVPQLNLFTWAQYISPDLIKKFEAQCGCEVVETDFSANGDMVAKLQAGGASEYDVVVPSSNYVPALRDMGLIQPIDHATLPNFKNLGSQFQNPSYDPNDQFSIPYQWGTVGIIYDTRKFKNPPESWGMMFDPKLNPDLPFGLSKGEAQGEIASACAYLGYGLNCNTPDQWKAAAKLYIQLKQRHNFYGFVDTTAALSDMEYGLISVGVAYNGDYGTCKYLNTCPHLGFFLPKEGAIAWVDTMAIPSRAPHKQLAEDFINFILDAHNGAALSEFNHYASPNAAAAPYMPDIVSNTLITPTPEEQKHLVMLKPITGPDYKLLNQIWTSVLE